MQQVEFLCRPPLHRGWADALPALGAPPSLAAFLAGDPALSLFLLRRFKLDLTPEPDWRHPQARFWLLPPVQWERACLYYALARQAAAVKKIIDGQFLRQLAQDWTHSALAFVRALPQTLYPPAAAPFCARADLVRKGLAGFSAWWPDLPQAHRRRLEIKLPPAVLPVLPVLQASASAPPPSDPMLDHLYVCVTCT